MRFLAAVPVALMAGGLYAAARGDVSDIEARVASAEDKEALDARHRTPLHVAVYRKQHDAARALVDTGANVNIPDGSAATPLKFARSRCYHDMVAILQKAGAK